MSKSQTNKPNKLKESGKKFLSGLAYNWRCFKTLVMMQLKEKLNLSFKADKKGTLTKLLLYFLAFVGLVAIIVVIFTILSRLSVFGLGIIPVYFFNVLIYLVVILNFLSVIHRLTNSLYFAQDNQTLLSYPCNNSVIFVSKLAVYYIMELVKSFAMLVPLFLAYGIVNSLVWYYYTWLFVSFLLLSFITVTLAAVLSLPYMYILTFFKKYQMAQSIAIIAFSLGVTALIFYLLASFPSNLQLSTKWATTYLPEFRNVTRQIEKYSGPLFYVPALFLGYRGFDTVSTDPQKLKIINDQTGIIVLVFLGISAVAFVIAYYVSRPLFFKMASKPFEYSKKFINHDFKLSKKDESIYKFGFKPIYDENISKKDKKALVNKLASLLRKLNHEEKLFLKEKIAEKRIAKFLKKYSKDIKFEMVPSEEITDVGYIIQTRLNVPFLVLVKQQPRIHLHCYDPYYLTEKNRKHNSFASALIKDILVDIRTPGNFVSLFLLFIITPVAISVLNVTLGAINKSYVGENYAIVVNILIILLIFLASNVSMASIYSREGSSSYLLKASPNNYMVALSTKLIIRAVLMTGSLVFTLGMYNYYSDRDFIKWGYLFFSILFIYYAHLIWCAELDYMKPQDRLYAEVGQSSVNNPNETVAAVLSFVISGLIAFFTYELLIREYQATFVRLFIVSIAFLAARIVLFLLKIRGYGTSRHEGRE